jgi:hypothetical protein
MVSPILFHVLPISFAGRTVTENLGKRKKCNRKYKNSPFDFAFLLI